MGRQYRYRMVTFAEQQFASLAREGKAAVVRAIQQVCQDPHAGGFDRRNHTWTFSTAEVVLQYSIEDNLVVVTILRVLYDK